MNAIDLYSGIGGWTLGMKLSGVNNVASYEWWNEANSTHNLNFDTNHKEIDIRKINVADLVFDKEINFIVGSPPCTQFSYANKGGNGDIEDGLIDIIKFLEVVDHFKPKYWAMENVPRVAKVIISELENGKLKRFRGLFKVIEIVDSSDYGVPQNRKRMIAGDFPYDLLSSYKSKISTLHLRNVLEALHSNEEVIDPNYGYRLKRKEVSELENEAQLTPQEERINRDAKTYHPIYNGMSFPDKLDRPSRTITATCTRVSRESIIIPSREGGFRRLNVRERGVIQGFPITYQFYGRTLNSKFKMIGNAVPPVLTYYIFQSMLEVPLKDLKPISKSKYYHNRPKYETYQSNLGLPKRKFPAKRKFKFAVPNLRYGSGVRFELSNEIIDNKANWSFKFFYGTSKKISEIPLNQEIKESIAPIINTTKNFIFNDHIERIVKEYEHFDSKSLQNTWTSKCLNTDIFDFLDDIGNSVEEILNEGEFEKDYASVISAIVKNENKKLEENSKSILSGFYLLSSLNEKLLKE